MNDSEGATGQDGSPFEEETSSLDDALSALAEEVLNDTPLDQRGANTRE